MSQLAQGKYSRSPQLQYNSVEVRIRLRHAHAGDADGGVGPGPSSAKTQTDVVPCYLWHAFRISVEDVDAGIKKSEDMRKHAASRTSVPDNTKGGGSEFTLGLEHVQFRVYVLAALVHKVLYSTNVFYGA